MYVILNGHKMILLGLGHENMVCAVGLFMFLFFWYIVPRLSLRRFDHNWFDVIIILPWINLCRSMGPSTFIAVWALSNSFIYGIMSNYFMTCTDANGLDGLTAIILFYNNKCLPAPIYTFDLNTWEILLMVTELQLVINYMRFSISGLTICLLSFLVIYQ